VIIGNIDKTLKMGDNLSPNRGITFYQENMMLHFINFTLHGVFFLFQQQKMPNSYLPLNIVSYNAHKNSQLKINCKWLFIQKKERQISSATQTIQVSNLKNQNYAMIICNQNNLQICPSYDHVGPIKLNSEYFTNAIFVSVE